MKNSGWFLTLLLVLATLTACQEVTPTPTSVPTLAATVPGEPAAVAAAATPLPQPTPSEAPTPTPEVTSGTVTLWHSWARADGDALAQILENFAAANPEMTVQTLYVAYNDLPQAYADAVAAGGGPGLILAPAWWLQELADAGSLLPLSERLQPREDQQWVARLALDELWQEVWAQLYARPQE